VAGGPGYLRLGWNRVAGDRVGCVEEVWIGWICGCTRAARTGRMGLGGRAHDKELERVSEERKRRR
jgi:hypothetical protein